MTFLWTFLLWFDTTRLKLNATLQSYSSIIRVILNRNNYLVKVSTIFSWCVFNVHVSESINRFSCGISLILSFTTNDVQPLIHTVFLICIHLCNPFTWTRIWFNADDMNGYLLLCIKRVVKFNLLLLDLIKFFIEKYTSRKFKYHLKYIPDFKFPITFEKFPL